MTTPLDRLIAMLEARGLTVRAGAEPGQLLLAGPAAEKTPAVWDAVKAFKPQLLGRFGRQEVPTLPPPLAPPPAPAPEVAPAPPAADPADGWVCRVCVRTFWVPEAEVREFADSPAFCDRSGAPEVRNRHTGGIDHPAAERCPYKSRGAV